MKQLEFNIKVKKLAPYKLYDLDDFKGIQSNSFSVLVSRAEKKKLIVKIGKGLFYRRDKKSISEIENKIDNAKWDIPMRHNKPSARYEIRHNRVRPDKYPIVSNLFWSNKHQNIPLDNFLSKIINEDSLYAYPFIQLNFGDRKVIEVYLNNFKRKNNSKELFEEFFYV